MWAIHTLVWLVLINGVLGLVLLVSTRLDPASSGPSGPAVLGVQIFMSMAALMVAMGVGVLGQGAIVGEIQTGTAAWVLTKPVSRSAFVLAKADGLAIQVLAFALVAQSVIAYALISALTGTPPPLAGFAAGVAILMLHTTFYVALAILLGTMFSTQGPIVGVIIGAIFLQGLLASFVAPLATVLPYALTATATNVATGQAIGTSTPIWATSLLGVVSLIVAAIRFSRSEF